MEHTFRQLQFDSRFLTALRTGLTRLMRWHLMEMFAIALGNPMTPVKEHAPRCVRDGLGEVAVLYHVAWLEFLGNNGIKPSMVKKFGRRFRDKVKPLTGNDIVLLCQCVLRFIPPLAPIRLSRQGPVKFYEFAFSRSVKTRVGYLLTIRNRQKIVCPNVHATSRFRNTLQRVRHFTNNKAIPPAHRLFQRDLFRVSEDRTVLADFHFT